jgi:hypothetical protein
MEIITELSLKIDSLNHRVRRLEERSFNKKIKKLEFITYTFLFAVCIWLLYLYNLNN